MKKIYLFLVSLICLNFGYSQTTLVAIDRTNGPGPTAIGTVDNISAQGFTRGDGITKAGNDGGQPFRSQQWNSTSRITAEAANEYIQWSVTADADFKVELTELRISARKNLNGPKKFRIFYSLDGFASQTALPGTIEDLTDIDKHFIYKNLTINSSFGGTITFRLYAWNAVADDGQLLITKEDSWSAHNIAQPGCILQGFVGYNGLSFTSNTWTPNAPNATTGDKNVLIVNGTFTINTNIEINDIKVERNASTIITKNGYLKVNGNLINEGDFSMQSDSQNYSSLIVNGISTGEFKYSRHVNSNVGGNDLISAPVSGQRFDVFRGNNSNLSSRNNKTEFLFGPFEKTSGKYLIWNNSITTQLQAGVGYRAASNDNGNFLFTGDVNTGTITTAIVNNASAPYPEWNLIGNPYTSYIKLSEFLSKNNDKFSTTSSGIYGYDGDASDGWTIWNLATLTINPDAAITPGQGFLVASKNVISTVDFTPEMRVTGTTDDFIAGRNAHPDNVGFLKLNISNGRQNHGTDIYFNEQSTKGLDPGYDASVFGKVAPAFSVFSHLIENNKGIDMAIQSLPYADLANKLSIPLGIKASQGERIVVSLAESILPEGVEILLEDNLNNTYTLLNTSEYTFTADSNLTDTGRFFLHTSNRALSTPSNDLNGLQIYTTGAKKIVFVKGLMKENTVLKIYDVQGRLINTSQLTANTNSNQVELSNLNSGIYVVELKSNTLIRTQKVILK